MTRSKKTLWVLLGSVLALAVVVGVIIAAVTWSNTPRDREAESPLVVGEELKVTVPKNSSTFTVPFTVDEADAHRIWVEGSRGTERPLEVRDDSGKVVLRADTIVPEELGGPQLASTLGSMSAARLEPGDYDLVLVGDPSPLDSTQTFHVDSLGAESVETGKPVAPEQRALPWAGTVEVPDGSADVTLQLSGNGLIGWGTGVYAIDAGGTVSTGTLSVGDGNVMTIEDAAPGQLVLVLSNWQGGGDAELVVDME